MRAWKPISVAIAVVLVASAASPARGEAKSAPPGGVLELVEAARDLVVEVGERVWPNWNEARFELLLVESDRERLIGRDPLPAGFDAEGTRERIFPPSLLATMAVFGPPATMVVGTPEATELGPTEWMLALLHEHFHQWQMRSADYFSDAGALELSGGDTTGRWMLEYPFPYGETDVAADFDDFARRLASFLREPATDATAARELLVRWHRWLGALAPADARYVRFQVWQEGVARFVELRTAEEAAAGWTPPPSLASRGDFEDFGVAACAAWERLYEELEGADLAQRRRVSFYAVGAGLALLLDRTTPGWKAGYERPRFAFERLPVD